MPSELHSDVRATTGMAKFLACVEMAKLKIYELWMGAFVAWSLLDPQLASEPRAVGILLLVLITLGMTAAVSLGLDDVAGLRDGVDAANHAGTDRYAVNKPLIDGRLSEDSALRFIYGLAVIAGVALAGALWLAWPVPFWLLAFMAGVIFIAVNYSFFLKLSYHGGGEFITFSAVGGTVLLPYGFVTGELTTTLVLESILVGAWMLQIAVFSNTQDADGDRAANRMTFAALLPLRGNYAFILGFFAFSWAIAGYGLLNEKLPPALAVGLIPVWILQIRQLWVGIHHEDWLKARLMGFWIFRLAVLTLIACNLIALYG